MQKVNLKKHGALLCAFLAVAAAAVLRQIGFCVNEQLDQFFTILRAAIYIGLFVAWGISVRSRIIQPQVRRYLTAVSALMIFWMTVRSIRYSLEEALWVMRHLWYLYYLPMLFIPLLAVFIALSLGKPESFRLPKWTVLLYIPTAALLLLVLTNDLHQLVFRFPEDAVVWMNEYRYGIVYFPVVGWMVLCALTALVIMLVKCRVPHSRRVLALPFVPVIMALVYGACYTSRAPWLRLIAGDMTVVFCLFFAAALESCIQCGLIRSNSHYAELFRASSIAAQITDRDLNVCYAAQAIQSVERKVLERAKQETVILDGGIRLCAEPIRDGYVFWQEDISALLALLDELSGTKEELESYNGLLEEENKQKRRRKRLEEQKRLFDMVQETIKPHLLLLSEVSKELQTAGTEDAARKALGKLAVIGAYLKRRSNLIMLSDSLGQTPAEELHLCLQESEANLRLCGVTCALRFDLAAQLPFDAVGTLFDFYETAVELSLDTLTDLTVFATGNAWSPRITLMLSCDADLAELSTAFENASITKEDGVWYCALTITEGGDTP